MLETVLRNQLAMMAVLIRLVPTNDEADDEAWDELRQCVDKTRDVLRMWSAGDGLATACVCAEPISSTVG